jgi:hypothetical protein
MSMVGEGKAWNNYGHGYLTIFVVLCVDPFSPFEVSFYVVAQRSKSVI